MHRPIRLALVSAASLAVVGGAASSAWAEPPRPSPVAAAAQAAGSAPVPGNAPGTTAGSNAPSLRQESKYGFEFSKAEVQDIVKTISDLTKQNFIIPERIKGQRITILCPQKVTADEAYQVFYTALAANGISIVRVGRFYKLLDSKDAIKDSVPTCTEVDGQQQCNLNREQMVTVLLRMRYIDAAQVNTVARALLSKDGDITVFQPSNALIISEYAPNLRRVRRIIESLDVAGFDDALQIVPIHHASATEVSDKLTQIFDIGSNNGRPGGIPPQGRRGSPVSVPQPGQEDGDVQISKIVPDDRTNQLIIKANRRSFDAIKHLISKIDVPISEAEHGRVHVYYLENAKSEDLASTLQNLAQGGTKDNKRPPGAPNLPPGVANKNSSAALFEGEVKITADKATNSLLVMASGHDYRSLRALIEKLDVSRRQVYVEAAILEVNIKDDDKFGLDYIGPKAFKEGQLGPLPSNGAVGFFQSAQSGTSTSTFGALQDASSFLSVAGGALGGVLGQPINIPIGSNGQVFAVPSFGLILKWLTTTSHANILSTPHILTTDNEEAHIEVGEKVPFQSGIGGGGAAGLSSMLGAGAGALGAAGGLGVLGALGNSVQRIDVSLKLNLTPQINERNKIRLEIDQQVEDLVGQDAQTLTPTTSKRAIKTVVVVDNQQTIVLGGLIKNTQTVSESRVPYLGSIPILGWLFKTHATRSQKTNLLLVLTPYIISSSDDFQRIFERKMREHEDFAAEFYGHRAEYRAHIDYQKKSGPLGRLVSTLRREQGKYENGGHGDGSESMVGPGEKGKAEDTSVDSNLDTPSLGAAPAAGSDDAGGVDEAKDAQRGDQRGEQMDTATGKDPDADADTGATGSEQRNP